MSTEVYVPWWWTLVPTTTGILGMVFVGRRWRWGWWVSVAQQLLWIIYGAITHQWGLFPSAGIYIIIYVVNYRHWGTKARGTT